MASAPKTRELSVSARPSGGVGDRHIAKPPATSSSHSAACHQRSRKPSSNRAALNAQNTTLLPADSASSGMLHAPAMVGYPAAEVSA